MTDKQIIIDDVDVSGCEYFKETLPSGCLGEYRCNCDSINTMSLNCEENNCIYKQLKRKEQECEELKKDTERWKSNFNGKVSAIEGLLQQLDQLKAENEILKQYKASKQASYESMQREWNDAVNGNRELKAMQNDLTFENKKFCYQIEELTNKLKNKKIEYEMLELLNKQLEHQLKPFKDKYFKGLDNVTIAELAKKSIRITAENCKLEQTLTEIKEIADYDYKELMNATDYHNMTERLQQILQKISECEVLDEQTNS